MADATDPGLDADQALSRLRRMLLDRSIGSLWEGNEGDIAELLKALAASPGQDAESWRRLHEEYSGKQFALWATLAAADPARPVTGGAARTDRRFRGPDWRLPYFHYLAESYLLAGEWLRKVLDAVKLDTRTRRKLEFFSRQWADAMAPANFPWTNPEAIRLASETQGESVAAGMKNLAADLDKGLVSMTDERAFEVGRNLAVTRGAVIFENDFMQLIQYCPTTVEVFERPLLMVPPCINKYYILDLQPGNSFVRHAIAQGHTVFMLSWRNMPAAMGTATWDDYLEHGVMKAIAVAKEICGVERINTLGFCVGGTLLACALAVAATRSSKPAASVTLLTTMLDYGDTGELSIFVDEASVSRRERDLGQGGLLHGRELALTFASLRANDLIWNYVVNNYLKGRTPDPFDLLYWNSDSTDLPGAMYVYYLRNMYLENNLRMPCRLTMCGAPVDLGAIDAPAYFLASREDHIVPWKTAYAGRRLLPGHPEFVLAASGHIAGVINPPEPRRRNFWVNATLDEDPDQWLAAAQSHSGSWWSHWYAWLAPHAGTLVPARTRLGSGTYVEIEPAPGRYVRQKAAPGTHAQT